MGEATITDFRDNVIYYTYEVGGVSYAASQDVSAIKTAKPLEDSRVIGHVGLKYQSRNPVNSIIICEDWSGLRAFPAPPPLPAKIEQR
jgi:hypothetical protein